MSRYLFPLLLLIVGQKAPPVDLKELLLLNDRIPLSLPHRLAVLEQSPHLMQENVVLVHSPHIFQIRVSGGGGASSSSHGHDVGGHLRRRGRGGRRLRQRRLSCGVSRLGLTRLLVSEE